MSQIVPTSEAELAVAVRDAAEAGTTLIVKGGGTRPGLGGHASGEAQLSTAAMSGITLYDPGALTLIVKAGTPVEDVKAALAAENQILPFEPMDHRTILGSTGTPTMGGVVALNLSGPRRIKAGACRDSVIGARFVDGTGQIVKSGGRVMKNVTGLDLAKLMCGSYGTLGVISEIAFKLLPAPETAATLVLEGVTGQDAVHAMSQALGTPYEVSGAASDAQATYLRVEGLAGQVQYRLDQLSTLLKSHEQTRLTADDHAALWQSIGDATNLNAVNKPLWRISVKPSDAPRVVATLGGAQTLLDWGGGLIWAQVDDVDTDRAAALRATLATLGGHASLVRNPGRVPVAPLQPEPPRIAATSEALRRKFDPRAILNPGKMAA